MTTLLLTEIFPPQDGGSGRWLWEVYRRLPREQVLIAAGEDPRADEFDGRHDVPCVRRPLHMEAWGGLRPSGIRNYARQYAMIRKLVRSYDISSIHCARVLPEGWIAWLVKKLYGLPYLCYVHGEELSYGQVSRELGWMMRRVLRGAAVIIANSRNTKSILRTQWRVASEKVQVVHPGVDVDFFVPAERSFAARRALGWNDRPVVLTVGRLQRRKGHDRLILALRYLARQIPSLLYSIVGQGEEQARLQRLAIEHGVQKNVEFRGSVSEDELLRCYQQCDLFVLPNREIDGDIEGFGMVLLEAQSCSKPVIAGDSGGTRETMRVPETGWIIDCRSSGRLAAAIGELMHNEPLQRDMGLAARHWVCDRFGWMRLAREAAAAFQSAPARMGVAHDRRCEAQLAPQKVRV